MCGGGVRRRRTNARCPTAAIRDATNTVTGDSAPPGMRSFDSRGGEVPRSASPAPHPTIITWRDRLPPTGLGRGVTCHDAAGPKRSIERRSSPRRWTAGWRSHTVLQASGANTSESGHAIVARAWRTDSAHLHFTPTSALWLNLAERVFFGMITRPASADLRRRDSARSSTPPTNAAGPPFTCTKRRRHPDPRRLVDQSLSRTSAAGVLPLDPGTDEPG